MSVDRYGPPIPVGDPRAAPRAKAGVFARTQWLFYAVCFYLASQAFTVPLAAIGPSWAVWPTLPDIAVGLVFLARVGVGRGGARPSRANASALRGFVLIVGASFLSYVIQTILVPDALGNGADSTSVVFGGFSIYRFVQFSVVWWGVAALPLDAKRLRFLGWLAFAVFAGVCAGTIATGLAWIQPAIFVLGLPHDLSAGAWLYFMDVIGEGVGTIGYNHAYVAAQIMLLLALLLHLARPGAVCSLGLGAVAVVACGLTGSRMGLIAMLLFFPYVLAEAPVSRRATVTAFAVLAFALVLAAIPWKEALSDPGSQEGTIYERQQTILHALQPEQLSGRDEIWKERLDFLNQKPVRWLVGGGMGVAASMGGDAHMQPLQILIEMGIVGLAIWGCWFAVVLRSLWKEERGSRAIAWVTVCFLISCISQETLYPVAALGHLLGLYVFALGIALGTRDERGDGEYECVGHL